MHRVSTIIATLVLVVAACSSGDGTDSEVEIDVTVAGSAITVTVDGAPSSERVSVPLGAQVHLTITSDVADEAHLHGYDLMVDLEEGVAGSVDFIADIPGIFEMELEASSLHIIELEVA